jgi:hypothetical protein
MLVAFFVFGGAGNIFASASILDDYQHWGYPSWFHYLTGMLELTTALLLLLSSTRQLGVGLGCALMVAAAGTVLLHGEYSHAVAPSMVFLFVAFNGWWTLRSRKR